MEASKLVKYVIVTIIALAVLVLTVFWSESLLLTALITAGLLLSAYVIYILNRKVNILILFFDDLTRSMDGFRVWLKTISDRSELIHEDLDKNLAETRQIKDVMQQEKAGIENIRQKTEQLFKEIETIKEKSEQLNKGVSDNQEKTQEGIQAVERTFQHTTQVLQEARQIKDVMQLEKAAIESIREETKKLLNELTQIQNHIQQDRAVTENIRQKTEQLFKEIEAIKEKSEQLNKGVSDNRQEHLEASEKIMLDSKQIMNELKQAHKHITHLENTSVKKIDECFFQIEALFSIFFSIKPDFPIQSTTGWAASAGLIKKVMEILFKHKPVNAFEIGSGLSTLIIGHCLKKLGQGKLIALEHEKKYLEQSQSMVNVHGLNDFVEIVYAPIKTYTIKGKKWLWYEDTVLKSLPEKSIDFLLIDGPPESLQPLSRYPAIPILLKYLKKDAIAVLDDANRPGEKEIMKIWQNEFASIQHHKDNTERGAFIISI